MKMNDLVTVALVVVGLGVTGGIVFLAPEAPETNFSAVEATGTLFTQAEETSEAVVTVRGEMGVGGHVTVHPSIGGAPGPVIAQSGYLAAGPFMASMKVQQPVAPGEEYIVLAYKDDGDATLIVGSDLPIMSEGKIVRADITAQAFPEAE